jgi:hypothetical protein
MVKLDKKNELLKKKNVCGIGLGHKFVDGRDSGVDALVVLVTKKRPKNKLAEEDLIPSEYGGLSTDVIEVGEITAQRVEVKGGTSIGTPSGTGTIGIVLAIGDDMYGISNNHVFADTNMRKPGDPIYAPGPADGIGQIVGYLHKYIPINFVESNLVDFATARMGRLKRTFWERLVDFVLRRKRIHYSSEIKDIGKWTGYLSEPRVGLKVKKTGRTTGLTHGEILVTNAVVQVNFSQGPAIFSNQIITSRMSDSGDSGSFVFDLENNFVGLLFAGSSSITVLNRGEDVLREFVNVTR